MKPTFIHRMINGPFEDPCLFIRIIREKRALLFDIGSIDRLKSGDLQKKIEVFCINDDKMITSGFYAENCFEKREGSVYNFDGLILKEPLFRVRAIQLDHQIPCLAFSLEEDFHININKASLTERGLPVGPWLSELKKAIREHKSGDTEFIVDDRRYQLEELRDIAKITKGQKVSFVTDVSLTDENVRKIIELVRDSDNIYCEAYFLEKERDRALEGL